MKINKNRVWPLAVVALSLLAMACVCTSALSGIADLAQDAEAVGEEAEAVAEGAEDAAQSGGQPSGPSGGRNVNLPVEVTSDEGGYRMNLPEGWVNESFFGITIAASNQALLDSFGSDTGQLDEPFIMAIVSSLEFSEGGDTSESLSDEMLQDMDLSGEEAEVSDPYPYTVGGVEGVAVDISGFDAETNQDISGRIVTIVTDEQSGVFFGMSPANQWGDFEGTFDAVMDSVEFFTPSLGDLGDLGDLGAVGDVGETGGNIDDLFFQATSSLTLDVSAGSTLNDDTLHRWNFDAGASETYTITVTPDDENFDVVVEIYGPDGNFILDVDDGFSGELEVVVFTTTDAGQYAAVIRAFGFSGGAYSIELTQ